MELQFGERFSTPIYGDFGDGFLHKWSYTSYNFQKSHMDAAFFIGRPHNSSWWLRYPWFQCLKNKRHQWPRVGSHPRFAMYG